VDRVSALQRVLRAKKPGENGRAIEAMALRHAQDVLGAPDIGRPKDRRASSPERRAREEKAADAVADVNSRLGISVEPVPAELVRAARIPEEYRGVRVVEVDPGSPAEKGASCVRRRDRADPPGEDKDHARRPTCRTRCEGVRDGDYRELPGVPAGAGRRRHERAW
jgi:hypothetical protein